MFAAPRYSFQRPANTTAYGASDLVANDVDAADVVPLSWRAERVKGAGRIVAVAIYTNDETVTNATFNLHLYRGAPSPTVGDNGVFAQATVANLLATIACDMSSGSTVTSTDKFKRFALTTPIVFDCEVIYGLLATTAAYDPDDDELFEITLEIEGRG
jgi:hypothetical protein